VIPRFSGAGFWVLGCRFWVPGALFCFESRVLRPGEPKTQNPEPEPSTQHPRTSNRCIECAMPKLTVEGYGTFDVAENKRLVLAIEQDAKVDILHACGGNARCTTCRVEFIEGEPSAMTAAEKERLEQRGLSGVRLSCQIVCDHDMSVRAISRLEGSGRPDPGRTPEETIQPPPVWGTKGA
jgi:ferredoxin